MSNQRCNCVFSSVSPHRKSKCSLRALSGNYESSEKIDESSEIPKSTCDDEYSSTVIEATIVPDKCRVYADGSEPYPEEGPFAEGVPLRQRLPTTPLKEVRFRCPANLVVYIILHIYREIAQILIQTVNLGLKHQW